MIVGYKIQKKKKHESHWEFQSSQKLGQNKTQRSTVFISTRAKLNNFYTSFYEVHSLLHMFKKKGYITVMCLKQMQRKTKRAQLIKDATID